MKGRGNTNFSIAKCRRQQYTLFLSLTSCGSIFSTCETRTSVIPSMCACLLARKVVSVVKTRTTSATSCSVSSVIRVFESTKCSFRISLRASCWANETSQITEEILTEHTFWSYLSSHRKWPCELNKHIPRESASIFLP